MKRVLCLVMVVGLAFGALDATTVAKKKKKKKRKQKPVATKLYLHGDSPVGEVDNAQYLAGSLTGSYTFMPMDGEAPTGSSAKSHQITTYAAGPNTLCAGNNLFPVWTGDLKGTVKGDVKFTFFTNSSPGEVDVRLWPDITDLTCNEAYVAPAREVRVPVAQNGSVEAVLKGKAFKVRQLLMLQISPATSDVNGTERPFPPFVGRVFYDSTSQASALDFKCLPASKKAKSCIPK